MLDKDHPSVEFTDLPVYEAGKEIKYSVQEVEVRGYESKVGALTEGKMKETKESKFGMTNSDHSPRARHLWM